ncbi:MAG TPA: glycosyltransferase [Chloroflexota bacterium]|nr:glycosyltransferase [Chloroflexota bacterium]
MRKPLVSVIMPAYNAEQWIEAAIVSVKAQSHRDVQLIVVDDGSTDATASIVRSVAPEASLLSQSNQGVSAARNAGIAAAKGDYIAFLDADDSWLPRKLERQLQVFLQNPDAGLVHTGSIEVDKCDTVLAEKLDGAEGWAAVDLFLYRRAVVGGGSSAMIRSQVCQTVGAFSTDLSTTADWDYYIRIAEHFEFSFVREGLIRYRFHGMNMHDNIDLARHDMLLASRRALRRRPDLYGPVRRQGLSQVHRILAGSYYHHGQTGKAIRHCVQSVLLAPTNIVAPPFPLRRTRSVERSA